LRKKWLMGAMLLALIVPAGAAAHTPPEDPTDPLGVVTGIEYIRDHTLGPDVMEVWVCHLAGPGTIAVTPDVVATDLNLIVPAYIDWISESRKSISFVVGGEVTLSGAVADIGECEDLIAPLASTDAVSSNGAVLVFDVNLGGALGDTGLGPVFPENGRMAVFGANHVRNISALDRAFLAHELGHTMHFPHSFTGKSFDPSGNVNEYDNLIDVMSGTNNMVGTLAFNRYAAGWIDPDQVVVYDGTAAELELGPVGYAEDQLLLIPGPDPHTFAAIDVRVPASYDVDLPATGITVHYIDEGPGDCAFVPHCSGIERKVTPADSAAFGLQHVHGVGSSFIVHDIEVAVIGVSGDVYTVAVGDLPFGFPDGAAVELRTLTETVVTIDWPAALGADDYTITGIPAPVTTGLREATITGLSPGTEYEITVVGRDDAELTDPLTISVTTLALGGSRVGLQNPNSGFWELVENDAEYNDFYYGTPGDLAVACDWDGDGIDTVGLYRPSDGFLYLRNSNTQGPGETEIFYGEPADIPVCGDWDGDGTESVGVYRPRNATFYLRNSNTQGFADISFIFGNPGDVPFAGDWDGDGIDTVGLYRQSTGFVYITNTNQFGVADFEAFYGNPGDRFVVGDWDGNGEDSFGIYRPTDQKFYLSNVVGQAIADIEISAGTSATVPIAGLWD